MGKLLEGAHKTEDGVRVYQDIEMEMRDGVIMRANLFRPDNDDRYPCLVVRLPYGKDVFGGLMAGHLDPAPFAKAGYNVVIQDCRGYNKSDGEPHADASNEMNDGYDTIEWLAAQDWCDGCIGTYGLSFFGMNQLSAAIMMPPHLRAAIPFQCSSTFPQNLVRGGAFGLRHLEWLYDTAPGMLRKLDVSDDERQRIADEISLNRSQLWEQCRTIRPLCDIPAVHVKGFSYFDDFMDEVDHMDDLEYWNRSGRPFDFADMRVPMFHLAGWYDTARDGTIENYELAVKRGGSEIMRNNQKLILGPWRHGTLMEAETDGVSYGQEASGASIHIQNRMTAWFDCWLKGKRDPVLDEPDILYFTLCENKWHRADAWPLPDTEYRSYFLSSEKGARGLDGDGVLSTAPEYTEAEDTSLHDPDNPVPSAVEGESMFNGDYSSVQRRSDVLVYSTDILKANTEVTGHIKLRLFVSMDAEDGDLWCRLTDVHPDGRAVKLLIGMVRARYRKSMTEEHFISAGEIYEYEIDIGNTSNLFMKGHRIRVDISGSSYPFADINLGTKDRIGYGSTAVKALHHVMHSNEYPSALILPVIREF